MRLFNNQTLNFKRDGNTIYGWAAPLVSRNIIDGSEVYLIVARSKAGLRRKLAADCPDVKVPDKAFLRVEMKIL